MFSRNPRTFKTRPCPNNELEQLNSSQGKVQGFNLAANQKAHVLLIGAGGIGSNVAQGLVRKGVGTLTILDDDFVELQNLTRQLFCRRDIGKNKALRLGRHLASNGLFPSTIHALPYRFQEALEHGHSLEQVNLIVCGVDNNPTRVAVSNFGIEHEIPVINAAVSRDGNQLYCAIQEPGKACFGCMFPHFLNDETYPCDLPGIIDVLQVVAGFIVYAADTILCSRYREWNLRTLFLDGSMPDRAQIVKRDPKCPLCRTLKRKAA